MRKHYLRKIALLAVGLIASATVALAQETTIYERGYETDWSKTDLTDWTMSNGEQSINSGLATNAGNTSYETLKTLATNDNSTIKLSAVWSVGNSTGRSGGYNYMKIGDLELRAYGQDQKGSIVLSGSESQLANIGKNDVRGGVWTINLTIDKALKKVEYSIKGSATNIETTGEGIIASADITSLAIGYYKPGRITSTNQTLTSIMITETIQAVTSASYAVEYVDANGTEIKETSNREGVVNSAITLLEYDKESFIADGKKYLYVSDDSEGKVINSDNSSVVTVTFKVASTYSYTVSASTGSVIVEGSNFEDEYITVPYPAFILIDKTLYGTNKQSGNPHWGYGFTLAQNNQSETITYTQSVDNVVYYKEAEDIEGATFNDGNNGNIRCSMQAGAYFSEDTEFVTLDPGAYKIAMGVWGNAGTTFTVNAGETAVHTAETQGYHYTTESEEFVLTEETALKVLAAGSNGKVIDWIYIIKTGDAVKVGSAGWTSFVTTTSVAIPENVEAYIVTKTSGGYAELTKVTGVVPTNTALLVNASESSYAFALSSEESIDVSGNILLASDGTVVGDGITIYALGKKEAGIGFYLVENGQSIPAGKAYLKVSTGEAKNFYAFGFDDATVINGIESTNKEGIIYNLKGQRVNSMTNGIYIVNGKKIFVK